MVMTEIYSKQMGFEEAKRINLQVFASRVLGMSTNSLNSTHIGGNRPVFFHADASDNTPSLCIYPSGRWKDFTGRHSITSGDIVDLVRRQQNCTASQALVVIREHEGRSDLHIENRTRVYSPVDPAKIDRMARAGIRRFDEPDHNATRFYLLKTRGIDKEWWNKGMFGVLNFQFRKYPLPVDGSVLTIPYYRIQDGRAVFTSLERRPMEREIYKGWVKLTQSTDPEVLKTVETIKAAMSEDGIDANNTDVGTTWRIACHLRGDARYLRYGENNHIYNVWLLGERKGTEIIQHNLPYVMMAESALDAAMLTSWNYPCISVPQSPIAEKALPFALKHVKTAYIMPDMDKEGFARANRWHDLLGDDKSWQVLLPEKMRGMGKDVGDFYQRFGREEVEKFLNSVGIRPIIRSFARNENPLF